MQETRTLVNTNKEEMRKASEKRNSLCMDSITSIDRSPAIVSTEISQKSVDGQVESVSICE